MALEQITFNIGAFNDADASGNNYFAGEVYEVFNTNDTLADIFSDAAGANPINQDGISNKSNASGEVVFYIDSGSYYILSGGKRRNFKNQSDLNARYNPPTVQSVLDSTELNPEGGEVFDVQGYHEVGVGGGKWKTVIAGTDDGVNKPNGDLIRQCVGVPVLALVFQSDREVSATQFGFTGNGGGEADRLIRYLAYISDSKDIAYLDRQVWYEKDIVFPSNVVMRGNGKTFTSSLIPLTGAVIRFGTDSVLSQHIEIRDVTITCSNTTNDANIVKFEKCYSVKMKDVRFFNVSGTQVVVDFEGGGDCSLVEVTSRPVSGGGGTNVVRVNSANTVDGVTHSLRIVDCDLEGGQDTIKVVSGHADISGLYSERSSRSILSVTGGSATIRGGQVLNSGGSALPVIVEGGSLTVFGADYYDGDGNEPFAYYLNSGDFSKSAFYGVPQSQVFINTTGSGMPSIFSTSIDSSTDTEAYTVVDMQDGDIINACVFTSLSAATNPITLSFELEAFVSSRGFGKAHRVVRGMMSKLSTGEFQFSSLTDIVNISEDSSVSNSIVTLTPSTVDGSTASINLALSLTGALNSGNTEQVWVRFTALGRTQGVNVNFYGNTRQPVSIN